MKRLLAFLLSVLPAIAWGATPTFDSFRGTNSGFIIHQPYIYVANTNTGGTNVIINGDVIYTNTTISYFVTTNFYDQSTIIITNSTVTITNSTVTINGTNVATINPTIGRIPFKFSDFQFGDSALYYIDTNTVGTTELDTGALVLSFNQIPVTLVAGENDVDVTDHSYVALSSSDPSAQLRLNNGNGTVTMMLLNQTGTTSFTLFNGDTLWDDGTSHIYLPGGDWTPTHNGDGLLLFRVPVGWMEAARFFANTNIVTEQLWASDGTYLYPTNMSLAPIIKNGLLVGTNSAIFYGPLTDGHTLASFYNTALGDPNYAEIVQYVSTNATTDSFYSQSTINQAMGYATFRLDAGNSFANIARISGGVSFDDTNNPLGNFEISLPIGGTGVHIKTLLNPSGQVNGTPYIFDTVTNMTGGNLAEFANDGTNLMSVRFDGHLVFGPGTTNDLGLDANGFYLDYTAGGGVNDSGFKVVNGASESTTLAVASTSGQLNTSKGVLLLANNAKAVQLDNTAFYPSTHGLQLGKDVIPFGSFYTEGTAYVEGFYTFGGDYSRLAISHTGTNGAVVFDSQAAGSAGTGRPFNFKIDGTNFLKLDGVGLLTLPGNDGSTATFRAQGNELNLRANGGIALADSLSSGNVISWFGNYWAPGNTHATFGGDELTTFKPLYRVNAYTNIVFGYLGSSSTNFARINLHHDGFNAYINSEISGVATNSPMFLQVGTTNMVELDGTAGASTTGVLIYENGTARRVTIGANDSGGAGFRVLRVPN